MHCLRGALGADPWPECAQVSAALTGLDVRTSDHLHPGRALYVEVDLAEPVPLAVLVKALGEAKPLPRVHWDSPQRYSFWLPPLPVFATGDPVLSVMVRRDG